MILAISIFSLGPMRAWCANGQAEGSGETSQTLPSEPQGTAEQPPKEPTAEQPPKEPAVEQPPNEPAAEQPSKEPTAEQSPKEPASEQPPKEQATEPNHTEKKPEEIVFSITEYQVEGNSVLPSEKIKEVVSNYLGPKQHLKDVDQARLALEKAYHDAGYPTVLVVVPQQTIENGVVRLKVIESKLGEVKITGNLNFSNKEILDRLPSLEAGILIYEPVFIKELNAANTNPDLVITPVLALGQKPETVDLELEIKDRRPMHGSLEWNNQGTPNTPRQRWNASIQLTNLFNRDQMLTFQTTQTHGGDVQVYGLSYAVPLKQSGRTIAAYGAISHSITALDGGAVSFSGGSVNVAGNSAVLGGRYIFPVGTGEKMTQQVSLGIDYIRLKANELVFPGQVSTNLTNPVNYAPLSVSYTGLCPDKRGTTNFSASLKGYVAGMVPGGNKEDFGGDPADLFDRPGNRLGSTGTFAVLRGGVERTQYLPIGFALSLKVDGQWASEPLIPAEEYFAGGVDTVRGYLESEELGDDAVHGTVELLAPALPALLPDPFRENLRFTAFYDAAYLWVKEAPAGQTDHHDLRGTGFGARMKLTDYLQGRVDFAWALHDAAITQRGDLFVHFSVKGSF